jgi:Mg-chelatase subunit ChlD
MALLLVVAALAQPTLSLADDQRTVLFLVDRSASISSSAIEAQTAYLAAATQAGGPTDLTAVAAFGGDLRVDAPLSEGRAGVGPIRAVVDESATDLAGALRAAEALLPSSGSRRIVVLTDGVFTTGDPRPIAQELGDDGIAVDIVTLHVGRGPDVLVEAVRLPPVARIGETVTATVVVRSNEAGPATVDVLIGDEEQTISIEVQPGLNELDVTTTVDATGFLQVTAEVDAAFDSQAGNNRGQGLSRVIGPASITVVEGAAGEADQLVQALEAAGLETVETTIIPDAAALLAIDALVLVNVPAPDSETVERLRSYVEDLGRGLVVIGGDQAYGLGAYDQSALEDLLPVRSNPDDLLRRQPVAEVLVIDTSGSMGRCHCRDGAFEEGGVNKTDISRAGAALAIDALTAQDRVGVVAFGSGTDWVIPFANKPSADDAEAALASLFPDGDTAIARGLEAALDELSTAEESLRHIVLFTDGWDPNEGTLIPLVREIADAGVTLSVLGTGEGPGVTLQRMAEIGGGR